MYAAPPPLRPVWPWAIFKRRGPIFVSEQNRRQNIEGYDVGKQFATKYVKLLAERQLRVHDQTNVDECRRQTYLLVPLYRFASRCEFSPRFALPRSRFAPSASPPTSVGRCRFQTSEFVDAKFTNNSAFHSAKRLVIQQWFFVFRSAHTRQ